MLSTLSSAGRKIVTIKPAFTTLWRGIFSLKRKNGGR
jgi:hypothetical protein